MRLEHLNRGPSWALLPLTRMPAQRRQYCLRGSKKKTYKIPRGDGATSVRRATDEHHLEVLKPPDPHVGDLGEAGGVQHRQRVTYLGSLEIPNALETLTVLGLPARLRMSRPMWCRNQRECRWP